MNMELSDADVAVLKKLIEHELADINPEIHHTGSAAMRDELKAQRDALNSLLKRLNAAV